jgi:alpha-tubulin suppressor-like RCC1 family protein
MFGLPIFRSGTKGAIEVICEQAFGCNPYDPLVLKSAYTLAQMTLNHYSLLVTADLKSLRAWGSCSSGGRTATSDTTVPQTATINWLNPGVSESIVKVYSLGSWQGGASPGITVLCTKEKNLYGTGYNNGALNRVGNALDSFEHIASDVTDFCLADSSYMLYVKSDGRLYGLGSNLVAGYGFTQANRRALTTEANNDNYLGINNASKVFCTQPGDAWGTGGASKSFVLLTDGRVMACGYNTSGCLGVGSNNAIVYEWSTVQTQDPQNPLGPTIDLTDVIDVITTNEVNGGGALNGGTTWEGGAGTGHMSTYFLTRNGNVYTCGNNSFGQLGLNLGANQTRNVATLTPVANALQMCTTAGGTSILVTTTDNDVFTWGNNQWGQLGLGDQTNRFTPTQANFPDLKIKMIHGGGMYGRINGAFLIVCDNGAVYGAGFNQTYALGITDNGAANAGPITRFTLNEYFGPNPTRDIDVNRYPSNANQLTINNNVVTNGSPRIYYTQEFQTRTVPTNTQPNRTENVYFKVGMRVEGDGIPAQSFIRSIDRVNKYFVISNNATASGNPVTIRFYNIVKVSSADLCGYGTEMAQKVVDEEGTLYMSGWNQNWGGRWNFNFYVGTETVLVPTFFDAAYTDTARNIIWRITGLPQGEQLAFADIGNTNRKIPYTNTASGYDIPETYTYIDGVVRPTDIAFIDQNDNASTVRKITHNGVTADLGLWAGTTPWISLNADHASLGASATLKNIINIINKPGVHDIQITVQTPPPPYTITPSQPDANEGETITWNVTTTQFSNGALYYTNNGTTAAADFTDNANSGVVIITNGVGTITKTLVEDLTTEGSQNITLTLRKDSVAGTAVAFSTPVIVNDTSRLIIPTVTWDIISGLPATHRLAYADAGNTAVTITPTNGTTYSIPLQYQYTNNQILSSDIAFTNSDNTAGSTVRYISLSSATNTRHYLAGALGLVGTIPWISTNPTHNSLGASQNLRNIISTINIANTTHNIRLHGNFTTSLQGQNNANGTSNVNAGIVSFITDNFLTNSSCRVYTFEAPVVLQGNNINVSVNVFNTANNPPTPVRLFVLWFSPGKAGQTFGVSINNEAAPRWIFPNGIVNANYTVFI